MDHHTLVLERGAQRVDVVHRVGEVPEVAAAVVGLGIPVVGELDLSVVVAGRSNLAVSDTVALAAVTLLSAMKCRTMTAAIRLPHVGL